MSFSPDTDQRYARQMILPEFGAQAQAKLSAAKIVIAGAGGLAAPVLYYLAAAGVGQMTLIDEDRIALSNLHRQILFETAEVGSLKAVAAAERLQDLNPEIRLIPQAVRLSEANAASLLGGHDLILDTTDNVATRLLINRMAVQLNIPLISGAVLGWAGHVAHLAGQPCYACLYPEVEQADADVACSVSGVMGSVAGIIGSWQATLAIRALCGLPDDLRGDMLVIHAAAPSMRRIRIRPVADCPVCGTEHR